MTTHRARTPTDEEIRNWYDRKYAAGGKESIRPFEAYSPFLDDVEISESSRLLDIACGTGFLLLEGSRQGAETFGVDVSREATRISKTVSPDSRVFVANGEHLPFQDSSFDCVFCLGSLEHFLHMDSGLQEMQRVTKERAVFCIMVPNSGYFLWRLSRQPGTQQQDMNENLLSLEQWKRLFSANGFEFIAIKRDTWPINRVGVLSSANPLKIVKRSLLRLAWNYLPLQYTYQFVFYLKKR